MPKCEQGKKLFKAWRDANAVYEALLWRQRPISSGFRPEITITLEEANAIGLKAQSAFLNHSHDCDDCRYFDGRDLN